MRLLGDTPDQQHSWDYLRHHASLNSTDKDTYLLKDLSLLLITGNSSTQMHLVCPNSVFRGGTPIYKEKTQKWSYKGHSCLPTSALTGLANSPFNIPLPMCQTAPKKQLPSLFAST
jgi:hypothetical protein